MNRGQLLSSAAAFVLTTAASPLSPNPFSKIESRYGLRLGLYAVDIANGAFVTYRADERFPMASTVKVPVVMSVLDRVDRGKASLEQIVRFTSADLAADPSYSRIAREHPSGGSLPLRTVCSYTISESDNTGVDLLFRLAGGPHAVEAYMHRIGMPEIHIDRTERELPNSATLSEGRDTATPHAMASLMQRLAQNSPLSQRSTALLLQWMRATVTGEARLRAGVPGGWRVADKTGTYANAANDIGLLYPPNRPPIAVAVYTFGKEPNIGSAAIAQTAREVIARRGGFA